MSSPAPAHALDRHRAHEITLGRGPVVAILLGLADVIVSAILCVLVASHGSHLWTHVAANGIGFALFGWVGFLVATARVALNDQTLRFVNVFFSIEMPVERIRELGSKRGLRAVMVSGGSFTSSAFGQSVLGNIFGYRRARRVAEEYSRLVTDRLPLAVSARDASRSIRDACLWLPGWALIYVAIASVASALRG